MGRDKNVVINFYLKKLALYRREGESDAEAAAHAARDTRAKFGWVPSRGDF